MIEARVKSIRKALAETETEALFVSNQYNIRYLSGFTGDSGWLLVTNNNVYLITDFRFMSQAKDEAPGVEAVIYQGKMVDTLKNILFQENINRLGFEADHITYVQYQNLSEAFPEVKLVALRSVVEKIRVIKDPGEIEIIKKSAEIADEAFNHVLNFIKLGIKEFQLAAEIEYYLRRAGAEKSSFDTIVGSGFRGALPHGTASNRRIQMGDLVVIDFGAVYNGYCSDMTRTIAVGEILQDQKDVYEIVLEAQEAAIASVRAGVKCSEVDAVARKIIEKNGYGKNYGHGLGHGVGMEVHESPALNPRNHDELIEGMVITIEPGIYLDGLGGVRIEDMILVTSSGCEVLTKSGKDLLQVV